MRGYTRRSNATLSFCYLSSRSHLRRLITLNVYIFQNINPFFLNNINKKYQIPNDHFAACFGRNVKRRFGLRIYIYIHADQRQNGLNVWVHYSSVKKIATFVIGLFNKRKTQIYIHKRNKFDLWKKKRSQTHLFGRIRLLFKN